MLKIAHIVNPVLSQSPSDLATAQPVTFESMRIARQQAVGKVAVELFAVGYPEDQPVMPDDFRILPPLTRSVLDAASFQRQRRLPLLRDILQPLYETGEADFLIYTNVDIALQPDFYLAVGEFAAAGYDAIVINRRTISTRFSRVDQIPQMTEEGGSPHRGWDCFVFERSLYPSFRLLDVCVGAARVGLALLANLLAYGRAFQELKEEHLTFHIGDERHWRRRAFADYDAHNTRQLMQILEMLEADVGPFSRDTAPGQFLFRKRSFGPLYEFWAQRAYLPAAWSQQLTRLLDKLPGKR